MNHRFTLSTSGQAQIAPARLLLQETTGFLYLPILVATPAAALAARFHLSTTWKDQPPYDIPWPVAGTPLPDAAQIRMALIAALDHAIARQAEGTTLLLDLSSGDVRAVVAQFAPYLNQRREALRSKRLRLVLFWPADLTDSLMAGAPDLWSMRALAPVLTETDLQAPVPDQGRDDLSPRPESQRTALRPNQAQQWQRWQATHNLQEAQLSVADALALCDALAQACDWQGVAELSEALLDTLPQDEPTFADRARALRQRSRSLAELGNVPAAVTALEEAVTLFQNLAAANPAAFAMELARSLNNLSTLLRDLGDHRRALETIEEAVAIWLRLAQNNPARFEPDLAQSLNNLSIRLGDLGDHRRALETIEEAVAIRRRLAQNNPARFEPDLARSLYNL
ncbi:MAG: hypothetical protein RIR00_811, partial [Pseudomonadota bacterium]